METMRNNIRNLADILSDMFLLLIFKLLLQDININEFSQLLKARDETVVQILDSVEVCFTSIVIYLNTI